MDTTEMAVSLTVRELSNLMTQAVEQAMSGQTADQQEVMSVKEAAEHSRLSVSCVRSAIKTGKLKVTRVGRRVLIHREALDRFLRGGM